MKSEYFFARNPILTTPGPQNRTQGDFKKIGRLASDAAATTLASTQLKVVCFDNRLPKGCQSVAKGKPGRPGCPGPWAQALALHHLHKKLLDIDSNHLFDETLGVMENYPWATEILGPQGKTVGLYSP